MKYIRFVYGTDYAGTDDEIYEAWEDNEVGETALQERLKELIDEQLETYEYLVLGWDAEAETEEEQEEIDFYYENCGSGYWKFVTKEEYEEYEESH